MKTMNSKSPNSIKKLIEIKKSQVSLSTPTKGGVGTIGGEETTKRGKAGTTIVKISIKYEIGDNQ